MRLLLLTGLFIILVLAPGRLSAQSTKITLNLVNVPLNDVLNEIEKKSDYTFLVNQEVVDVTRKVDAVFTNTSIKNILDQLFKGEKVKYVLSDHQIIITPVKDKGGDFQSKKVTGRVTDEITGETLIGVTIQIKGTTSGTTTSIDGTYTIDIPSADAILVFSYVGYEPKEVPVKDALVINVIMHQVATQLESVVVTALGIKREEKALGYAVQKVDGKGLQTVKTADVTNALTGKIAGLQVNNSSNFGTDSRIYLRGENALIVVDGIPSDNIQMKDISPDDIKSIDVLKGATASALYGSRGANGAIMVTTVRGDKNKGLSVSINSSTMFNAGFLTFPEIQHSYSSGFNGHYNNDYIWGDKLDIGRKAILWDPVAMDWGADSALLTSKGKNNLRNFMVQGYVTNNNVSVVNQGEQGSIRSSISWVNNKGQFPNQIMNKVTYSLGGDIKIDKFTLESNFGYTKSISPNTRGNQYSGGLLYNLVGWLGSEWDVRDYKNYWKVKDQEQNWFNVDWYDNPYFLSNEVISTADRDIYNGFVSAGYNFLPWLKLSLRSGFDSYINREIDRNPISSRNSWSSFGYYSDQKWTGYSLNNDLMLSVDKTLGDLKVEGVLGGSLYYAKNDYFGANTAGGISIPGYYSLYASVNPIQWDASVYQHQTNSLYGRATLSWKSLAYIDITGRNDWASTLSANTRSYFYPSIGGSLVLSELLPKVSWLDMWKIRSSWTTSKGIAEVYAINSPYTVYNSVWGGMNSAVYPTNLQTPDIRPNTANTLELGTAAIFLKGRAHFDITVYQQRQFDFIVYGPVSDASGFSSQLTNTAEEHKKKGMEIMLGGSPIETKDWKWDINLNWSKDATYYSKLDPQFSGTDSWIAVGKRVDAITVTDWLRDPDGNLINDAGFPVRSNYSSVIGNSNPDWIWGINSSIRYKSFTFSFSVDGRVGGMSYARLDAFLLSSGAAASTDNTYRYDEVVNGLTNYVGPGVKVISGSVVFDPKGNIISDSRVYAPNDVQVSYESYTKDHYQQGPWSYCSQNFLDETFVKLREASLSYQIPALFAKRIKMKDMSVSFVGQNLLYWGKQFKMADPDYGATSDMVAPSARYIGLNLKCNF